MKVHASFPPLTPEQLEKAKEALPDLVGIVQWIGQFVSTAKDGGHLWCAMRGYEGSSECAKTMTEVLEKIGVPAKYE